MDAGDACLLTDTNVDNHLWIVISDSKKDPTCVLLVNLTTWRPDKDQACKVWPGDHPFVTKESCINYAECRTCELSHLHSLKDAGLLAMQSRCSASLLKRIRDAAATTKFLKMKFLQTLIDQGLVDIIPF